MSSVTVIEWYRIGCGAPGCTAEARWMSRYPGEEHGTRYILPLGEFTITCSGCDTQVSVHTVPLPPAAPRYVAELRAIAEREGAA